MKVFLFIWLLLVFVVEIASNGEKKCVLYNTNGSTRTFKVLVFIDYNFMEMFMNWLKFFKSTCNNNIESLEVVCMDDKCHQHLKVNGLKCSNRSFTLQYEEKGDKLWSVWSKRLQIVNDYLLEGVDLILSDSDALWVQDPMPMISQHSEKSALISSRGWWPWPLYHKWGSCLCMGFIYIKAGPFSSDIFLHISLTVEAQSQLLAGMSDRNETIGKNVSRPDDQRAINFQLSEWGIRWVLSEGDRVTGDIRRIEQEQKQALSGNKTDIPGYVTINGVNYINNTAEGNAYRMSLESNSQIDSGVVERNGTEYFVTLLPQNNFVRNCHNQSIPWRRRSKRMKDTVKSYTENAIVAHCRLPTGDSRGKKRFLSTFGLWKMQTGEFGISDKEYYNSSLFNDPSKMETFGVKEARAEWTERQQARDEMRRAKQNSSLSQRQAEYRQHRQEKDLPIFIDRESFTAKHDHIDNNNRDNRPPQHPSHAMRERIGRGGENRGRDRSSGDSRGGRSEFESVPQRGGERGGERSSGMRNERAGGRYRGGSERGRGDDDFVTLDREVFRSASRMKRKPQPPKQKSDTMVN